jgi:FAD/FMN-containing dehydrogenase
MSQPAGRVAPLSGWGRYPVADCRLVRASRPAEAAALVQGAESLIARGCGRSYGDCSLNSELTVATGAMDRLIAFDEQTGQLTCEAGLRLADLIDILLPRGWLAPVTPGTRFVTIGGMIAADVHGKNHHVAGSFCDHLDWIDIALPGGPVERCSRETNADLFAATCGGMGLTGIIVRAAFRLKRVETSRIRQRTIRAGNLEAAVDVFEASLDWTYSVAWVDCLATGKDLGRSVVFLGEHALADELPDDRRGDPFRRPPRKARRMPVDAPSFALGPRAVRLFNGSYYRAQRDGERLVDFEPYFYPLDAIGDWNRIYGRRGFMQYQCVLPLETSRSGMARLLEAISSEGAGSFLAVLKRMGPQSFGLLSFGMPGYTLALDFPVSESNLALLVRLDAIVAECSGRLYLAKDARAAAAAVEPGYPRLPQFRETRRRWGLDIHFSSLQSKRLGL